MLVLARKVGETIVLDEARITVMSCHGGKIRLGIEAPGTVKVLRLELFEREQREAGMPADAKTEAA